MEAGYTDFVDIRKPRSLTNPLINPKITVKSAQHTYELLMDYFTTAWFTKNQGYERGISDLEKYCEN